MAVAPESPVYDSAINRTAAQLAVHLQECAGLSRVVFWRSRDEPRGRARMCAWRECSKVE
jgi:hypothetical protein